jgi:hypothetical protein
MKGTLQAIVSADALIVQTAKIITVHCMYCPSFFRYHYMLLKKAAYVRAESKNLSFDVSGFSVLPFPRRPFMLSSVDEFPRLLGRKPPHQPL